MVTELSTVCQDILKLTAHTIPEGCAVVVIALMPDTENAKKTSVGMCVNRQVNKASEVADVLERAAHSLRNDPGLRSEGFDPDFD